MDKYACLRQRDSEDSDQTAHDQADLSLRYAHMS